MKQDSVFFITGASKGMGLEIAKETLCRGFKVVASARRPEVLEQLLGTSENLLAVKLDLTSPEDIKSAVQAAIAKFGRIDYLINNAGFGLLGYFEETSEELIRKQFETNFFGTINLTREVLPHMRRQKSGYIVTTTSTSGVKAVEGDSIYAASKFALEGWMEGLNFEVKPFGINCMILEPGAFRTDFFKEGSSFIFADMPLADYKERREALYRHFTEWDGNQDGNPVKLAKNLLKALSADEPPFRILISKSAYPQIDAYYQNRYAEFKKWHDLTVDTEFDGK